MFQNYYFWSYFKRCHNISEIKKNIGNVSLNEQKDMGILLEVSRAFLATSLFNWREIQNMQLDVGREPS